ncbi:hypothetical protein J2741_002012 [Methanolinea mesophila]|uniref:hypothetical protein n=1 Tax=Methanolinea mesophila TaxID=547055 RepID=UPI001AE9FEC3|nr:hypothetical protein [Methanolinea mesophila]MBP1929465.1 hypothetical protein [Methanolinea mesophila]
MKKTALFFAGIVSATILVVMGLGILLTGSFYFTPSITIDPFSDRDIDGNGMLVLTGTTNLGLNTHLLVNLSAGPGQVAGPDRGYITEIVQVLHGTGGRNTWKAALNVSSLAPGDYTIRVSSVTFSGNNWTAAPGTVVVARQFRLGGETAGENRTLPAAFIVANFIGDKVPGARITVNGTTSLPTGTTLLWDVYPGQCPVNGTGSPVSVPAPLLTGSSTVATGTSGVNRWALLFNSSGMAPGCYLIRFSGETPEGMFSEGAAEFVLSNTASPEPQGPGTFITIDTLPGLKVNSRVVITGTTSLPEHDELLIEISPVTRGGYDFLVNPRDMSQGAIFAGVAGTAVIVAGTDGVNLWAMDFDTYHLPPGDYAVNVHNTNVNLTTFRAEPGDVSAIGTFTVREGSP